MLSLESLSEVVQQRRSSEGLRVVHCHGVFDLLHIGHLRHLEAARNLGDLLVVTVTPDRFVNKGPGRPAFPENLRAEALASLAYVDYVAVNHWPTATETLLLVRPDVYAKGSEYRDEAKDLTGKIGEEIAAVRAGGGDIGFTEDIVYSSTQLIQTHVAPLPEPVREYLGEFKQRHSFDEVYGYLQRAEKLKVLVVGEAIIDEYQYCEAIGKSSKEPTLVARRTQLERFAGGVLAVANHLADFADHVQVLTMLGKTNSMQDFVEANLHPKVGRHYVFRQDGPTIVKRRYVERYFFQKLFEMYDLNDVELNDEDNADLCAQLERLVPEHDLVVVVDYGHGFLSRESIRILCEKSKFLAVNAQCNAGNQGYHTISHYARADFITTTEKEMRLEARRRGGDLQDIVSEVAGKLMCGRLCVTRGSYGCLTYESGQGFHEVPAIAGKVVDRVGAGDAFLAVAALCAAQGAPLPIVGLAGNAAGAQAVATVCNQDSVRKLELVRHLQALLK